MSGGSIFASAWAASIHSKTASLPQFLARVRREVEQGFEGRAFLHPRILKTALPGVSRTDLLASTFERLFCPEMTLKNLPPNPSFFFNTAVMHHGQIGRFSRAGFTSTGLLPPGQPFGQGQPVPMPEFPVARAATASAAFPDLLPPLRIPRDQNHVPPGWGASAGIGAHDELALADGGVLDNLGIEAFLSGWSGACCRDVVVSDAGPSSESWKPKGFLSQFGERVAALLAATVNLGMGAVSALDLFRVSLMMQGKSLRQMRHHLMDTLIQEVLAQGCLAPQPGAAAIQAASAVAKGAPSPFRSRRLFFVRLDQDWDRLLQGISPWRMVELADQKGMSLASVPPQGSNAGLITEFLNKAGVDIAPAKTLYGQMCSLRSPMEIAKIPTRFKGIRNDDIIALGLHARWQVNLLQAIY